MAIVVSCTEVVQTCHIPCFAIVGKWIACGICGLLGCSVEIVRARCNRIAILSQTCHRARLAGQVVIAVASALVSIGSSAIAIDIGLPFLELVVIGLQDLGVLLIDVVDVVSGLVIVIGVFLGRVRDEDILHLTPVEHLVFTR